jgi:hypothetical protein
VADPLTVPVWKYRLGKFFNVRAGPFKPGRLRYEGSFPRSPTCPQPGSTANWWRLWNFSDGEIAKLMDGVYKSGVLGAKAKSSL